jgi:hypothetical protein
MDNEHSDERDDRGYSDPDDPLVRARREAVEGEEPESDRVPGTSETMESWERERRMDPGSHEQPRREHERPLRSDELPDSSEQTQG